MLLMGIWAHWRGRPGDLFGTLYTGHKECGDRKAPCLLRMVKLF